MSTFDQRIQVIKGVCVDKILRRKFRNGQAEYRVQWVHKDQIVATWEHVDKLRNYQHLIDSFDKEADQNHQKNSSLPEIFQKRKRGRPRKIKSIHVDPTLSKLEHCSSKSLSSAKIKKPRGRPPLIKNQDKLKKNRVLSCEKQLNRLVNLQQKQNNKGLTKLPIIKRGPGRPRKNNIINSQKEMMKTEDNKSFDEANKSESRIKEKQSATPGILYARQGSFDRKDVLKRIMDMRRDQQTQLIEFEVTWEENTGKILLPSWVGTSFQMF